MTRVRELTFVNIEFQVPWGHIAGKEWGDPSSQHILAVHGLQHNCGSFDRLICLLHGDYHIVAIDLPGHGLSSHFPAGVPLEILNYLLAIAYVTKELGWKNFSYLGHSLGGDIALFFAAIFPEYLRKLIVVDQIAPLFYPDDQLVASLRTLLEEHMDIQARIQTSAPKVYSYEQALEKFLYGLHPLTEKSAKIILKRSLRETEGGFTFRIDERLKQTYFASITSHVVRELLQNVKCPALYILSTENYLYLKQFCGDIFEYLREKPNVTIEVIEGGHNLHQNHPDRIVGVVDKFFSSNQCKL